MQEIAAVRGTNGYTVVSTFSGCGGSCLGFELAGYRVLWANEFIPAAQAVYRANHPDVMLNTEDIRAIQPQAILKAIGLKRGEIDVLEGSPPCASFSTAGKREKGWGKVKKYSDTKQRVDDLFFEYARILKGLQPKVFVAENVSGLVKGTAKGYFKDILAALKACGYRVQAKLLDSQWLGVPQARQRIIFIGVRNDLGHEPVFPKPLPYRYSVREALPWITRIKVAGEYEDWRDANRPSGTIVQSDGARNSRTAYFATFMVEAETDISRFAIGREWDRLRAGEKGKYLNLVKPKLDRASPTITAEGGSAGAASVTHPTERRKFSIAELKRICAFPDDFVLTGTFAQQWERLGRAVPPLMMQAIAETIKDEILCKLK